MPQYHTVIDTHLTMTSPSKELKRDHQTAFRPIGDIAAAADALKGDEDAEQMQVEDGQQSKELKTSNDEELDHPVESIESLCMQCGENVGIFDVNFIAGSLEDTLLIDAS